jgi:hypothetical protein
MNHTESIMNLFELLFLIIYFIFRFAVISINFVTLGHGMARSAIKLPSLSELAGLESTLQYGWVSK